MTKKKASGKVGIPRNAVPWLVFEHIVTGYTFIPAYLGYKSRFVKNDNPKLLGKFIVSSQYGWLILLDFMDPDADSYLITLWNPVTSKTIDLPLLSYHHDTLSPERCFLTSPPPDDDESSDGCCFVVLCLVGIAFVCQCPPNKSCCWVSERIEIEGMRAFIRRGVALNGVIYCVATVIQDTENEDRLVSIQITGSSSEEFDSKLGSFVVSYLPISLPKVFFSEALVTCYSFLVECCGIIYITQIGRHSYHWALSVKVWELDLERQISVPVKSLGDRAFFLTNQASAWVSATTDEYASAGGRGSCIGVRRNCLYFFDLDLDLTADAVILYDLDDCSSTYLPCPRLRDPCSPNAFWVMPQPQLPRSTEGRREQKQGLVVVDATKVRDEVVQLNEKQGEDHSSWTRLPQDIIELFGKHMHLFDYWNFRCTSKMIQSATLKPCWRTNNTYPLLLVFNDDAGSCRLIDPCRTDSRPFVLRFNKDYFDIKFSKDSWLLLYDGKHLQFINPFTSVTRDLPRLPHRFFSNIGFSTRPTCSKCLTVTINYSNDGVVFNYHRYGDTSWNTRSFDKYENIYFVPGDGSPIYHKGAFYFIDKLGYLGVLEWIEEEIKWRIIGQPIFPNRDIHSCYLINHGEEELLAVVIGSKGKYVSMLRFNENEVENEKIWIDVKSLGNYVLFISPSSSFSVPTTDVKMNDRIYLPWMKGEHIVYYSLKTQKYHVDEGGDLFTQDEFFGMKNPSRCCWI